MKQIYIGAAYYPEMWDESEIDKDIARCKSLGINTLRVGEFAWGDMEPREGEFNFGRFLHVVDKLYKNGIYTVMCTPSATPPRWLLNKYEETRLVSADCVRVDVSSRCHTCKTSPVMREKNRIIVTEMAKAFKGSKGIIGWQIDNEIFPYSEGCFCPLCKSAFRRYLKHRYGAIDNLNDKWGMARWSLKYDSFDDVEPPYPAQWRHPSLRKVWWDFQCAQVKSYVDEQAEILHEYGYDNVGTDMMSQNYLSYYDVNEKLDVVQYNHYNTANELPDTAFAYDFLRCVKDKPFWVTETQVGWNGSEFADSGYRPAGNCYANSWLPVAKGAEMNLYWLFRTHPNGHELGHGALYSSAGRINRVTGEVKSAVRDFEKCRDFLINGKIRSQIALSYSATAMNCFSSAPLLKNFDYRKTLMRNYYGAFKHYNVDVIDTPHRLDGYKILISSFLAYLDEMFKERVTQWINDGGTWIVGPLSDVMDGDISKYTDAPYPFVEELAGVYTVYQKPVDNDVFRAKWRDGAELKIGVCFDAYECSEETTPLAVYDGGEFGGLAVITERKVGKGRVILVGSIISHADLLRLVNLPPIAEASDNVILTERSGGECGIIAVETMNKDGWVSVEGEYEELISGEKLSGKIKINPYQVLVLKKIFYR